MSDNLEKKNIEEKTEVSESKTEESEVKICPYCKKVIGENDNLKECPKCGLAHHLECWNQHDGCSNFSCASKIVSNVTVCKKCGMECDKTQKFCPNCGFELSKMDENICVNCGSIIPSTMRYCPMCGKKKTDILPLSTNDNQTGSSNPSSKTESKRTAIVVVVVLVFVGILVFFLTRGCGSNGADLTKVYDEYCGGSGSIWAELSDNGKTLSVDIEEDDMTKIDAMLMESRWKNIKSINSALNLPESLNQKLNKTRAIDGRQTETYDNIEVSWSYHPNQGLEIIYTKK